MEKGGREPPVKTLQLPENPSSQPDWDLGDLARSMGSASCEDEELEFKLVFGEEKEPLPPQLSVGGFWGRLVRGWEGVLGLIRDGQGDPEAADFKAASLG